MKKGKPAPEVVLKNLLVLVLLLIIFVSLLGTVLVTTSIKEVKESRQLTQSPPQFTGAMIGFAIEPVEVDVGGNNERS